MRKYKSKTRVALVAAAMLFCTADSLAGGTYGFGNSKGCDLWRLPFPISLQQPGNERQDYDVNLIWIDDDSVSGMDKYYDFYQDHNGRSSWPSSPIGAIGGSKPYCTGSTECVTSGHGSVGKGISAYDNLVNEFSKDAVNVYKFRPNGAGNLTWLYLPTHKVKLLRIEVFTPYTGYVGSLVGYEEPIYFEYRATGNGSEMKLKEWGSTADKQNYIDLPETFDPVLVSDIQVWFTRYGRYDPAIYPKTAIHSLSDEQIARVPGSCK